MNLYFYGHNYKYAAEQMMLTLFPGERPAYPEGDPVGDRTEIHWQEGTGTVLCRLVKDGIEYVESVPVEPWTTELDRDRAVQRAVKLAFYRAALASGVNKPAWGALTGVRPGKLFTPLLESGMGEREARREFMDKYDVSAERAELCLTVREATSELEIRVAAAMEEAPRTMAENSRNG